MTAMEPQSTAAVLALCLIATLASAAPGQVHFTERRDQTAAIEATVDASSSQNLFHYGILGPVERAGVYISVHNDLSLAELVAAAGGTTSQHSHSARVVRWGQAGPWQKSSSPSTAPLTPGDVVVLEPTIDADSEPDQSWIGIALVGILPDEPVVVLLPSSPPPTLPELIAKLQQQSTLIDSVRVVRTSSSQPAPVEVPRAAPLMEGDIVVFDPATINRQALAGAQAFPPPVLIPERVNRGASEIVIQPQQHSSAWTPNALQDITVTPLKHSTVDQTLRKEACPLPDEASELAEQPSQPRLASPGSTGPADVANAPPQAVEGTAVSMPDEPDVAANLQQIADNPPQVLVTSLLEASQEIRPRSRRLSKTVASPEPERMAPSQSGALIALASRKSEQPAIEGRASRRQTDIAQVVGPSSSVPPPSDPVVGVNSGGFAIRALTVGVTVLATALICFAVSLLWSRLDDSTGPQGSATGRQDENLPVSSGHAPRSTLERLINNTLPIIEEPMVLPDRADFHGEAVGRRRMRIDAEQDLSGPHRVAPQPSPSVVAPASAVKANTRPESEQIPAKTQTGDAATTTTTTSQRQIAEGGLLDRVLVAMERERQR